jgi:cell division protein ZapE
MTLRQHLDGKISRGEISRDKGQDAGIAALDSFLSALNKPQPKPKLFGLLHKPEPLPIGGVYLYGPVGRGKTFLMDHFIDLLPKKMRVMRTHFHRFMLDVHAFSHAHKQAQKKTKAEVKAMDQVLLAFADSIAEKYDLLAFDEFHVVDVADAMLLGRLIEALLERRIALVLTSNWPPADLYKNGLQRDRFLPVIDLITSRFIVAEVAGASDYRRQRVSASDLYLTGPDAKARLDGIFEKLTDGAAPEPVQLEVNGRKLSVPTAARGVARLSFADLCMKPLAAQDYIALADAFDTVLIDDIPQLSPEKRNEAKRFMILVDVLYEQQRLLIVSAAADPDHIYDGADHGFEFQRTASRLLEMQSEDYLKRLS